MLKNITIIFDNLVYLNKDYAISFKNPDTLLRLLKGIDEEITSRGFFKEETVIDILTMKIVCYKVKTPFPLFIALTFDDSIVPEKIYPQLHQIIESAVDFIERVGVFDELSDDNKKLLEKECEIIYKELLLLRPPKICILGHDKVGKTSICELIKNRTIPEKYIETTNLETHKSQLYGVPIILWDIPDPGDLSNEKLWSKFILGSDALIIVIDSTEKNAKETKSMIEITNYILPNAELLVIANMQDKENALKPEELENILNCKVLPFNASDLKNGKVMQEYAAKLLELKITGINYEKEEYIIQRND
ncbi:MAG: hypothetical protein GY870_19020 [archaeon]|nr:hypothetical protein [archaeon]